MKTPFVRKIVVVITVMLLPAPALSQVTYRFNRMWPTLKQPWYFFNLSCIATDKSGNIYVSDYSHSRIYKLSSDGTFITSWGRLGSGRGAFYWPQGIAVDSKGFIYVGDSNNNRIQKFTSDGTFEFEWPVGSGLMELKGIAVDENGYIYVTNKYTAYVQKFTPEGTVELTWGDFASPQGIAVYEERESNTTYIYVVDTNNNRVQKFTSDSTWIATWESPDWEFNQPEGIAVDAAGDVYVTDHENSRIQKFSQDGIRIDTWEFEGKPKGISVISEGYIFVTDGRRIHKLSPGGIPMSTWGSSSSDNGIFDWPRGIALDEESENDTITTYIYVVDSNNHRVQKFTQDGTFELAWGDYGTGDGEFDKPGGIDVDAAGNVYVADTWNHRIQKFGSDGTFTTKWGRNGGDGSHGSDEGEFYWPKDITVDGAGNVYVADTWNYRIQKFSTDGTISTWGRHGLADGQFYYPEGIAVDKDGYVYVADSIRNCTQKFTSDGIFELKWGRRGEEDGEFNSPQGIAVDAEGYIYVADNEHNRIQKFESDGTFITAWGDDGTLPGQMAGPTDLSIASDGRIYVVDNGNDRIQVFEKYEPLLNPKAIIVAGGGPYPGNSLWDATQASTNFAYWTLVHLGFNKEDIFYLTSDTDVDIDGNGTFAERDGLLFSDEVYAVPTNTNLQQAVTDAVNDGADSLVLYFSDHGATDSEGGIFYLNEHDTLKSKHLDDLLKTLEEDEEDISDRIVVIYDACQSGSFIDDLSGENRIIVTSTLPDERAKFLNQGTISFSSFFWTNVFNRLSIDESYLKAKRTINFTFSNQNPQLSGSAENIYIDVFQGEGAEQMVGDAPTIVNVSSTPSEIDIIDNNEASTDLYAEVAPDPDGISRVWAVIWQPGLNLGSANHPLLDQLETVELFIPLGEDYYKGTYDNFEENGIYQIAIYAMDGKGNTSIPKLTSVSLNYHVTRKAIIVAGGVGDSLTRPMIETYAGLAYDALISQGYNYDESDRNNDDIYFMGVDTFRAEVEDLSLNSNLETHLNSLADPSIENLDLTIYLIGGGGTGTFQINNTQTLPAIATPPEESLALWLNNLQNSIPCRVTLVYDGDNSGSFIPLLTPPEGMERVLITSSGADEDAYFSTEGDISFSYFFWHQTSIGSTLYDSFAYAKNAISYFSRRNEISFSCYIQKGPLLDANGNSLANEALDYNVARGLTIGIGQLFADDVPPSIRSVAVEEEETGLGLIITAEDIRPPENIVEVWAEVKPIGYCPGSSGEQTVYVQEVSLNWSDTEEKYKSEPQPYDTFPEEYKAYKATVYAKDADNNTSSPKETKIYQREGGDIYEPDESPPQANVIVVNHAIPQPHNFHYAGDEDWVKFYGFGDENLTYRIKAGNLGDNCKPVIKLYHEDDTENYIRIANTIADDELSIELELDEWGDGIYYVLLHHNPDYPYTGERTEYHLQVDNEDAGGLLVLVTGRVQDQVSWGGLDGVFITTNGGAAAISSQGEYDLYQKPGPWFMQAQADGYGLYTDALQIRAGDQIIVKDILMNPIRSECTSDAYCTDGRFCNGLEYCEGWECHSGSPPCTDDGLFCNGEESCDEESDVCVSSGDPCAPDLTCDEGNDVCTGCFEDADCNDELFCNGEETCVAGVCRPGTDPCRGGEECDEENDECKQPAIPCSISIEPEITEMVSGQSVTFTIIETGDCSDPDYEWSVDSTIGSSCDPNGSYVAGTNDKMFQDAIDVVELIDKANSLSASATITVSGKCFLVQIYGEHSEEVKVLRHIRDEVLDKTPEGKDVIRLYYQWSPVIIKLMEGETHLKEGMRGLLDGIISLVDVE